VTIVRARYDGHGGCALSNETTVDRWGNARAYAALLGEIPSSFTSATRTLAADPSENCSQLAPGAAFLTRRLIKTSTISTALAFAGATFHPERYPNPAAVRPDSTLVDYRPLDLAALIGLVYIYRRAKALCPGEEWSYIDSQISRYLDTAMHVGFALKNAGGATGIFLGGYIPLAQAMFLKHDLGGYREYRRHLKANSLWYDPNMEVARWGCSSAQLAAFFIQNFGLGVKLAQDFVTGVGSPLPDGIGLEDSAYRFYIVERWTKSLLHSGEIPDMTHQGRYYPLKDDLERLRSFATATRQTGSRYRWLEKSRDDLESSGLPAGSSATSGVDEMDKAVTTEDD